MYHGRPMTATEELLGPQRSSRYYQSVGRQLYRCDIRIAALRRALRRGGVNRNGRYRLARALNRWVAKRRTIVRSNSLPVAWR